MTPREWGMKLSRQETEEYIARTRQRYICMIKRAGKSHVLDRFCDTTGYERKHAIKLLNRKSGNRKNRAGRKPKYDETVKEVILEIWKMSDQLCTIQCRACNIIGSCNASSAPVIHQWQHELMGLHEVIFSYISASHLNFSSYRTYCSHRFFVTDL